MPRESALRTRDVNPKSLRSRTIDLDRQLERRRVRARSEAVLDVLQRDQRAPSAACGLRLDVAQLSLQPHPALHRSLADTEEFRELRVGTFARLVGGNDALTKRDWMTVNHPPTRSETDPRLKASDQIIRALGLSTRAVYGVIGPRAIAIFDNIEQPGLYINIKETADGQKVVAIAHSVLEELAAPY